MTIHKAHAYLVRPGKNAQSPDPISSEELPLAGGKLADMLEDIFGSTPSSRDFDVTFNPDKTGAQANACRSLMIDYQKNPTLALGHPIAQRLQKVTDHRSGAGLLFLLSGLKGLKSRLVVSRFPTDQAILAEVATNGLAVEFLEQVFIKRLSAYKALMLEDKTPNSGFWTGSATDRQAGGSGENISEYWLIDFLNADFSETPAAGTRRLVSALKQAIKTNPNLDTKGQIASASSLAAQAFHGKTISIDQFCTHFGFTASTTASIKNQLSKASLFTKQFKFDSNEFKTAAPYRTVELNTGAILTAPNEEFESVFRSKSVPGGGVEYSTSGKVNDQRLAKR